jgi:hypothetical protein
MEFREPNEVLWRGIRPAHKGTQVAASAVANNDTQIIYTVNANKTLFLVYANIDAIGAAAANAYVAVRDAADAIQYYIFFPRFTVTQAVYTNNFAPSIPLEIPEDYDIVVNTGNAAVFARSFIFGWEE